MRSLPLLFLKSMAAFQLSSKGAGTASEPHNDVKSRLRISVFAGEGRDSRAEEQNPKGFSLTVGLPFSGMKSNIIYWWDHKMNHKERAAHKGLNDCFLRMWPFSYSKNNNRRQSWVSQDVPIPSGCNGLTNSCSLERHFSLSLKLSLQRYMTFLEA